MSALSGDDDDAFLHLTPFFNSVCLIVPLQGQVTP